MHGTESDSSWVVLGSITGAYGVHGWIRIRPLADDPESWLRIRPWFLRAERGQGNWSPCEPLQARLHGRELIARIAGREDRDAAENLRGNLLAVPRQAMPEPEPGAYYWGDLVGMGVIGRGDVRLGIVDRLIETGANDVLVVRDAAGHERLLPFVASVIEDVDRAGGLIRADWDPEW